MKFFKLIFLVAGLTYGLQSFAQEQDTTETFPYILPVWGQKVADRGMADQLQLPFGLNVNYVNAFMELEITQFELLVNGKDFTQYINTETLNFTSVYATTNGLNFRADAWILPFMNIYGMYSAVTGGTNVTLQPTWRNSEDEIILQLPEFSSDVKFDAEAFGLGSTLAYGVNRWFGVFDANYSLTKSALLDEPVGFLNMSARVGRRFGLSKENKDLHLDPYVGLMYRNFIGARGSNGSVSFAEVFPDANDAFNNRANSAIAENEAIINDPNTSAIEKAKLTAENEAIETIQNTVNESGLFTTTINYFIEKELIQTVTFQFGFIFQINKNWLIRGEYGIADSQRMLNTGVLYRFGVKKKEFR